MTIRRASLAIAIASILLLAVATKALAVNVSGTVRNTSGTALCGLVLANGQFVFSCSPTGAFSLDAPLDANGQITLFAFVDGHFPYKVVLTSGGIHDPMLRPASASPPPTTNRERTEMLLGGTWTFAYSIGSTSFSQSYSFSSVIASTSTAGEWNAVGRDSLGDVVIGGYISRAGEWGLLDPSVILDRFFTFTFSDLNHVSGCYYQLSPPGSTNLGTCYRMTGVRTPFKHATAERLDELGQDRRELEASTLYRAPGFTGAPSDSGALQDYSRLLGDFPHAH